jgi:thymidylate kinase
VREAYLARVRREPQRLKVVDATGPVDAVEQGVRRLVAPLLGASR